MCLNILSDHPAIRQAELEGVPEYIEPHCPVCGAACELVYRNNDDEVLGCDFCVTTMDAWEEEECFPAVMEVI